MDTLNHALPEPLPLAELQKAYRRGEERYLPEDSPYTTLFADITHRCNMSCKNCYIPVRDLPDLPVDWLYQFLERLPRRTRIRLVGAEPTMRKDLPEIIQRVRKLGHTPVILSNGLKLANPLYVTTLKNAGLRTVYLSLNGGLDDQLYLEIDELACADRKLKALDNLLAAKMNVTSGSIVVPGLNDQHLAEFLGYLIGRGVRDIHLRSVGPLGRHMPDVSMDIDALEAFLFNALGSLSNNLKPKHQSATHRDYHFAGTRIQLTAWPDLGSPWRGRIAPDGFAEPMFESIEMNAFSY